jgi:broad specificity phosphatase PhoE
MSLCPGAEEMKILLIRHGEPDYTEVGIRKYMGHGLDLAHLNANGKEQAQKAAEDPRLDGIEIIVSSPYTRALHTAAIISRYRNVEIEIELGLHEWLPDLTYTYTSDDFVIQAGKMISRNKGICPSDSPIKYEELTSVFERANSSLKKYLIYKKIAVVAHGVLIRQFSYAEKIPYCSIMEIEYDENYKWVGFVEKS